MTRPTGYRGAFFHGSRDEVQSPRLDVEDLAKNKNFCVEITPREALKELKDWPDGLDYLRSILRRHGFTEDC